MEKLGEYIIPLIFAGIYFISNILTKRAEKKAQQQADQPAWEPPEGFDLSDLEQEIPGVFEEVEPAGDMSSYDRRQLERRQAADEHRQRREVARGASPPPLRQEASPPPPLPVVPSAPAQPDAYESTIERQLRQIEETKRKAEALKKQAGGAAIPDGGKRRRTSGNFSGSIRNQLKDPAAARKAFIFGEILGPCVSSGEESKIPGLS